MTRFEKWSRLLVLYTLLVILWGAWVRISHSGDGCGDTWPLCQGQLLPSGEQSKTWVELSHRLMSGLFGFFVLGLFWAARRVFPKAHPARFWAGMGMLFTISEALLGAKLVLFGLVAQNDSPYRAFVMSLHLVNSMLLTASLALACDFASQKIWHKRLTSPWSSSFLNARKIIASVLLAFLFIGITGAIASLATTLFPSQSLLEGLQADWDENAHYLVRLRSLHPFLGLFFGGSLAMSAWFSAALLIPGRETENLRVRSRRLGLITFCGVAFGIGTLLLLSPIWMKLSHLLLAHGIWILLVLWVREILYLQTGSEAR